MRRWFRGPLRATLTLYLLLGATAWAQSPLQLERLQEGDPDHPRALILVHGVQPLSPPWGDLSGRQTWTEFLERWTAPLPDLNDPKIDIFVDKPGLAKLQAEDKLEDKSWALRQYCSVYTFNYNASILNMKPADEVAVDLHEEIKKLNKQLELKSGKQSSLEIILIGHSNGGLVARDCGALMLKEGDKKELHIDLGRIVFLASPLDGVVLEWIMEVVANLNSGGGLKRDALKLGRGYSWIPNHLANPLEQKNDYRPRYKEVHTTVPNYVGYGTQSFASPSSAQYVLYGKGYFVRRLNEMLTDGLVPQKSAKGTEIGPTAWKKEAKDKAVFFHHVTPYCPDWQNTLHVRLPRTPEFLEWVTYPYAKVLPPPTKICEVLDSDVLTGYLKRREAIEYYCQAFHNMMSEPPQKVVNGSVVQPSFISLFRSLPPSQQKVKVRKDWNYWDPRKGTTEAYATRDELKKYMWEPQYAHYWEITGNLKNELIESEMMNVVQNKQLHEVVQ